MHAPALSRLQRIREKLELDQHKMASFLEMKRSHLSMIELGKRSEPPALKKHLDELDSLLFTKKAFASEAKRLRMRKADSANSKLQKEIKGLQIKMGFAKKTLAKMETDYMKHTIAMHSFQTLIVHAEANAQKPNPVYQQQIYILEAKLQKTNGACQEILKSQIKALRTQITHLETVVA